MPDHRISGTSWRAPRVGRLLMRPPLEPKSDRPLWQSPSRNPALLQSPHPLLKV